MLSIETLNAWADRWATFMWGSLLDTTVILAVVSLVWLTLRRWMPAQLGYCLFLLVLVKLCVPGHITVSDSTAYLSPQHALEQLGAFANRLSSSNATHDSAPEDMLGIGGNADE